MNPNTSTEIAPNEPSISSALDYAGKMLSSGKVRDQQIVNAFCQLGEKPLGLIVAGTAIRPLRVKIEKSISAAQSHF